MIYAFGELEVDDAAYELRRAGIRVRLEPKVFDVLVRLLRHRERVVTKTELLETVWVGEHVTEAALPRAIAAARKAIGDDRQGQRWIRTVHGRGYRFVGPVREQAGTPAPAAENVSEPRRAGPPKDLLIGRDAALQRASTLLSEAAAGRGRLLLLSGEAGIGKTRLAEAVIDEAFERGFEALTGRSFDAEGAPAFWPWVQILRECLQDVDDSQLAAELGREGEMAVHLVPELAGRLGRELRPLPSESEEARFRLFDAVTRYLQRRSRSRPLLLFLDDLHQADRSSALLLRFLLSEIRRHRVLVLGAYRDTDVRRKSAWAAILPELARSPDAERMLLRGLDPEDARRLATTLLGTEPDRALTAAVAGIARGNPLFLHETLRLLRSEGALASRPTPGAPPEASDWRVHLPQGLREAIGRRLDRLSEECNRLLTLASVIGPSFSLPILARLAETPADRVLELLHPAVEDRIVVQSPEAPGRYAFAHHLIHKAIYEELSTPFRVRLHRNLALLLEAFHGASAGLHLDELARHFFEGAPGGDIDKAVGYAVRAGREAQRLAAYEDAAAWITRALQALDLRDPDDEVRRCELLLDLGTALDQAGERQHMREAFSRAAQLARSLRRSDLLALAALGYGGRTERGIPDAGVRGLLEEALDTLGDDSHALRSRLLSRLAGAPPYSGQGTERLALSEQAVTLARTAGDGAALIEALFARAWALAGPDHLEERLLVTGELLSLAERLGDADGILAAREARLRSLLQLGDMSAADREIAAYAQYAEELRQPVYRAFAKIFQVGRALATGRFAEAEALMERCLELNRASEFPAAELLHSAQRTALHFLRGELDRVPQVIEPLLLPGAIWVPEPTQRALEGFAVLLALATTESEEVRRRFESMALHGFQDLPRDEHWLAALTNLATLAAALGDAPRAGRLYALLEPYAELNAVHDLLRVDFGSVSHYLGVLAATRSCFDAAAEHFEAALAANERMGARTHVVRSQAAYAGLLRQRGRPGDRERARTLLAEARAAAAALGMRPPRAGITDLPVGPAAAPRTGSDRRKSE